MGAGKRYPVYHAGLVPMERHRGPPPAASDPLHALTTEARERAAGTTAFYVDGSRSAELLTTDRRAGWAVIRLRADAQPGDDPEAATA